MSVSPRVRVAPALIWTAALSLAFWSVFAGATAAREVSYAGEVERGDGVKGAFTAQVEKCSRNGCVWYGEFAPDGRDRPPEDMVKIRGLRAGAVDRGRTFRAIDVGSAGEVFVLGRGSTRGDAIAPASVSFLVGAAAIVLALLAVVRTPWRAAAAWLGPRALASRTRALSERDRWGVAARPPSAESVKLERPSGAAVLVAPVVALVAAAVPVGLLPAATGAERLEQRAAAVWGIAVCILAATLAVQLFRAVPRPRLWLGEDELVLWDPALFWRALRVRRDDVAAVGSIQRPPEDEDGAVLSPFREEPNLNILLRHGRTLPARRLRWGNWVWLVDFKRRVPPARSPIPLRGRTYRRLSLRAADPGHAELTVSRWLLLPVDPPRPPAPLQPADHFLDRRPRTYRGDGRSRLTITGTIPQPVLLEIGGRGDRELTLSVAGQRTDVPPGRGPARTVINADGKRKRTLRVRADGPWEVTLSGAGAAAPFTGEAEGHGPDVLAYRGPAGIAAVTSDLYTLHQVWLRDPDLTGRSGDAPLACALQQYDHSLSALGRLLPSGPSVIAVPSGALLQIAAAGGWHVEVMPLARLGTGTDPLSGPGMTLVRPFETSLTGTRAAVVLYTGPRARLRARYRGTDRLRVTRLDRSLVPVEVLAPRAAAVEIEPMTLLQVGCGQGRWTLTCA